MRCKTYCEEKECISERVQINLFQNGIYEIFSSDEQFALNKYSVYLLNADHSKHFSKVKSLYIKIYISFSQYFNQNEYSSKLLAAFKTPGQSKMSNQTFMHNFEQIRVTKIMLSKIVILFVQSVTFIIFLHNLREIGQLIRKTRIYFSIMNLFAGL